MININQNILVLVIISRNW